MHASSGQGKRDRTDRLFGRGVEHLDGLGHAEAVRPQLVAQLSRLRDLRRDLASALASCERLIPMLENDVVTQARLAAVRDELRGVLRRHFAGSPS